MSTFDAQDIGLRVFLQLRGKGFQLGIGEFRAALEAIDGGFGAELEELAGTLKLLWCHSLAEQTYFDSIWESIQQQSQMQKRHKPPFPGRKKVQTSYLEDPPEMQPEVPRSLPQPSSPQPQLEPELAALPVQAPYLLAGEEEPVMPQAYYPISRRSMVYGWRSLRRLLADGPADVLDVQATIRQVTRRGVYMAPVYTRRQRNQARLLLLLDQNGSMAPFHHFTRNLVETAKGESSLKPENVDVFYFQNIPVGTVYRDCYLMEPVPLQAVLDRCDDGTSVLIVSDAGAARGFRTRERVRGTSRFLYQLKRYTSLIAWLNPMSSERWVGSSAEIIANSIPMFQLDKLGLSNAIDVVRGQPLKYSYFSSL